ncbi:MAG: cob(I)yrinic acid a,c-diamide adenosyltransferase [Halioglobus sp.]|jgi:cob(I)alamin adenosyltransferase|uniref:Corrinoid adenosyltransferase n=1 Tax=Candidatus Seongchinamella marina TaxID=2518990 RepID=A0ABT3SS79_9GAMM|nr:cob(I)yrinic acid a,c-diamide adenosyltransferase [Candidatus Seongchinamella marina]EEB77359.1 cob(I)yrinic acid a,c-diamide adenosyltransferase [marine gamma proteobacterium HTCC2148]MBT3410731.1 cob(I)yrinic acid a,c-diamide adenosyltransferase [Halieaceae bacterium]MDG1387740.1 cob(I)yrinic acid a,c-diamide adenosyltransferase [Halioglobus sp.]MBT5008145.1 cob(I)yrinic acid a,c-diamide adenosyltransferase [Halieaceae bacterium]MBT6124034.1 cob(I)yrinic acid a,c-diamide adenosyltransfera
MNDEKKNARHKASMEKQKAKVDSNIEAADEERGVSILLTGNGKGKSSSAFGMVMRALGYGHKVGVIQFIKGQQLSGEEIYLKNHCPEVDFYQMGTGFTWDTQDREGDIKAAQDTWAVARPMLDDPSYDLVVLDEITYMLAYKYLPEETILEAIANRPRNQSVVVTGRGGGSALQQLMDTVSEVKEIKHAFQAGVKARLGVDY